MTGLNSMTIIIAIIQVVAFIPAIVLHECAHGYAAYKLGDPTAKRAGRLTLNPLAHVDPFGTVVLPGILILSSMLTGGVGLIFGYAKPVPYNPNYFKNIRLGEALVGLAGPAANIGMAVIGAAIAWLGNFLYGGMVSTGTLSFIAVIIYYFGVVFCEVNLALAFFNLIPLPPLDGSSIIALFLTDRGLRIYYQVQRYAMFILLLLIFVLPYFIHVDILGIYLQATAGNLAALLLP